MSINRLKFPMIKNWIFFENKNYQIIKIKISLYKF